MFHRGASIWSGKPPRLRSRLPHGLCCPLSSSEGSGVFTVRRYPCARVPVCVVPALPPGDGGGGGWDVANQQRRFSSCSSPLIPVCEGTSPLYFTALRYFGRLSTWAARSTRAALLHAIYQSCLGHQCALTNTRSTTHLPSAQSSDSRPRQCPCSVRTASRRCPPLLV